MLMPSPVMVMAWLVPGLLYVQLTPLCFKVAEVVLAVTTVFGVVVLPLVTESHFLSVSSP